MHILFVCIVAFAPTALWAAALTSHSNGFDARKIAGRVESANHGFTKGLRANVTLADPARSATDDISLIHPGRTDLPPSAVSFGTTEIRAGGRSTAAPDLERIGQYPSLRANAGASVASTRCVAPDTDHLPSGNTIDTPAPRFADCHRA
jgi:hypothetical protein